MVSIILSFGVPILAAIVIIGLLVMGYVKAPPDTAFLISGCGKRQLLEKHLLGFLS